MKLTVLFFARVREDLDCDRLQLDWPAGSLTLDGLLQQLGDEHGAHWREVLGEDNMIRAVNQVVVHGDRVLEDGDEVAFFPPVTGG